MPRRPFFIFVLVMGALLGQTVRANEGTLDNTFQFKPETGWFPIHHRRWNEADGTAVWARHVIVHVPRDSPQWSGMDQVHAIQISHMPPKNNVAPQVTQTVKLGHESAMRLHTVLNAKMNTKNMVLDEAFRGSEQLEFQGWEFQSKVLDIYVREGNDLGRLPVRIVRNVLDGESAPTFLEMTDNQDVNRRERKRRRLKDPKRLNEAFRSPRKERKFKKKFGLKLVGSGVLETAPLRKISRWHEFKHAASVLFWVGSLGTGVGGGLYLLETTGQTELMPLVQERVVEPTQEWIAGCEDEMERLSR